MPHHSKDVKDTKSETILEAVKEGAGEKLFCKFENLSSNPKHSLISWASVIISAIPESLGNTNVP